MTSLKVIAYNNGEIARVIYSEAEEARYAQLPPLSSVQSPVNIDLTENSVLAELADGNNWYRYRLNSGNFTRDGVAFPIHPNSEAESDRQALPQIFDDLRDYFQLDALDPSASAAQTRARVIESQAAIDDLIRGLRYISKHLLKVVP